MFNTVLIGDVYHVQDESGRTIHSFSRALQPPISTPVGVVAPPSVSAVPARPPPATTVGPKRPMVSNTILRRLMPLPGSLLTMPGFGITGTPSLNKYGLPPPKRPREVGAGRTFLIRRTPMATSVVTTRCLELITPNGVSDANIMQDFEAFAELNGCCEDRDRHLYVLIFVIDMTLQGIKPTSAKTYLSAILRMAKRIDNPIRGSHIHDSYKILDLLISEEEASHARDITLEEAILIHGRLSGVIQATIFFMIICGARVKDLSRFKRHQILLRPDGRISINFRYTKNHHTMNARYTVIVPCVVPMPPSVAEMLRVPPETEIFPIGVDEINRALHEVQAPPTEDTPHATSYSFRRRFVQETVAFHTNEEGWTNWVHAARLTGHVEVACIRNRYLQPFQNTL